MMTPEQQRLIVFGTTAIPGSKAEAALWADRWAMRRRATSVLMADLRPLGGSYYAEPIPDKMYMNNMTYHRLRRAMLPRWHQRVWPWLKASYRRWWVGEGAR